MKKLVLEEDDMAQMVAAYRALLELQLRLMAVAREETQGRVLGNEKPAGCAERAPSGATLD